MLPAVLMPVILIVISFARADGVDYRYSIEGIDDNGLRPALVASSVLEQLKDQPPQSLSALRRRTLGDIENFENVMRSRGYFDPHISYEIDDRQSPAVINIRINPGDLYRISDYGVTWQGIDDSAAFDRLIARAQERGVITLPRDEAVSPDMLNEASRGIMAVLMQHGYAFPRIEARRMEIDHDTRQAAVFLDVNPGPKTVFGPAQVTGLENVVPRYVMRRLDWEEGQEFDVRRVPRTRQRLAQSRIFAGVDIRYDISEATLSDDGETLEVPMNIQIVEARHRSIGAGLFYSTSTGLYSQLFWEHRNLFGGAERLHIGADLGLERYGLAADFTKPDLFGDIAFSFQSGAKYLYEELEAYDRTTINASAGVNYQLTRRIGLFGGVGLERTEIEQPGRAKEIFALVSTPLSAKYDSTDDLLDPRRGMRLSAGVTPYQSVNDPLRFYQIDTRGTHYWPVLGDRLIWANRARMASVRGADLADIPADKRLYAGGGGSVRGYGYQILGPLDKDQNPTGGQFLVEMGTELRYRVTETIGVAGFAEGGRLTENIRATGGGEPFRWSLGIGGRYHTVAGPVRVDIAVPMSRRQGVDDRFQFYISLGQAF